ncbi:MAG: type II secretion system protein [Candidatus Paceibacterota bacterium]|jgi:prepilin-type N-terminal cleavage/methylation domain-containing protein
MNKLNLKKGFTLLELLVVIAIIGILSAVIFAALNSARNKGGDAGVKSNLRNAMSQAEIFYNTNTAAANTYTNVCTNGVVGTAQGIGVHVLAAAKANGYSSYTMDGTGTPTTATCNDNATAWAAEVPLKSLGANQTWCVDSLGKSKQENNATIGAGYACP